MVEDHRRSILKFFVSLYTVKYDILLVNDHCRTLFESFGIHIKAENLTFSSRRSQSISTLMFHKPF